MAGAGLVTGMIESAVAEVRSLHDLLARWLAGDAPETALDEFASVHDEQFTLVTTSGAVLSLPELLGGLATARGARPGMSIGIDEVAVVASTDQITVLRFTERHHDATGTDVRRTTAVLTADPDARNGWGWAAVHETAANEA